MNDDSQFICPECGRNTQLTKAAVIHKWCLAWTLPKAIIGLMILSVLLLSLPGIRSAAGIGWSSRSWTTPREMAGAITPDPAISLHEVRAMLAGETEMKTKIFEALRKKLDGLDDVLWEGRIRFAGIESKGVAQEVSDYGFFVSGCRVQSQSLLRDVRDLESWDLERATPMESAVIYWPYGYMNQSVAHENAYMKNIWFDYIDVLAVIASVWFVVWIFGIVLKRFGIPALSHRHVMAIAIVGLLGLYIVASALYPTHRRYLMVVGKVNQSSGWIQYETLMSEIKSKESEWNEDGQMWKALASISLANPESDLLLGLQFDYGHDIDTTWWWINLGSLVELSSGSTVSMTRRDGSAEESMVETPDEFGRGFDIQWEDGKYIALKWTSDKQVRTMKIEPTAIVLLLASVIWIWKLNHWVVRAWIDRQTLQRIRRDQCVFCAYPLTHQAALARNHARGDPPEHP